jgi:hypothetical protein
MREEREEKIKKETFRLQMRKKKTLGKKSRKEFHGCKKSH